MGYPGSDWYKPAEGLGESFGLRDPRSLLKSLQLGLGIQEGSRSFLSF